MSTTQMLLDIVVPKVAPGDWIAWRRPILGRCRGRVRSIHPRGIKADRLEVIDTEIRFRAHDRPRTKPHFIDPTQELVEVIPAPPEARLLY